MMPPLETENRRASRALSRTARGESKIAQGGHVRSIRANASGIHRKAQPFGQIQIDTGVIQLREAEAGRRQYAVNPRGIYGPRGPQPLPRTAGDFEELPPVAFVPG